jgi:hypothetical protein
VLGDSIDNLCNYNLDMLTLVIVCNVTDIIEWLCFSKIQTKHGKMS